MAFVASSPAPDESCQPIVNHPFFPEIELQKFRDTMRVDNVATANRARHALYAAMLEVNGRLANWMLDQQAAGHNSLSETPEKPGHPTGANAELYSRAVYSLAKSSLVERYRDYDTTGKGASRADELDSSIDELRRDAAWAINDLIGTPRTTVELI